MNEEAIGYLCPAGFKTCGASSQRDILAPIIKGNQHEQLRSLHFSEKIRHQPQIVFGTLVEMAHPLVPRLEITPEIAIPGKTRCAPEAIPIKGWQTIGCKPLTVYSPSTYRLPYIVGRQTIGDIRQQIPEIHQHLVGLAPEFPFLVGNAEIVIDPYPLLGTK